MTTSVVRHSPTCVLAIVLWLAVTVVVGVAAQFATATTATTVSPDHRRYYDDGKQQNSTTNPKDVLEKTSKFRAAELLDDVDDYLFEHRHHNSYSYYNPRFDTSSPLSSSSSVSSSSLASGQKRAIRTSVTRWPKGILPYVITPEVQKMTAEYERVMAQYESHSCIRFVPYNATISRELGLDPKVKLSFVKGSGCWSSLRYTSCCTGLNCIHEIGHTLGFPHEHSEPKRKGWIRINPENMWPKDRGIYNAIDSKDMDDYPYDLSSKMNYLPWMFSNGRPTLTVLFPELKVGREYFYMFSQIAGHYKCYEKEPCQNANLTCVNDGFVTVFYGKCACMCPQGLDPDTGCSTPLNKESREFKMPRGQYALPMPKTGCPDDTFHEGHVTYFGDGNNKVLSSPSNMKVDIKGANAEQYFCTRNVHDDEDFDEEEEKFNWPDGKYCVLRKGGQCPEGMYPGFVQYDGNTPPKDGGTTSNPFSGELPDGVYGNDSIKLELCCQFSGFTPEPIALPNKKPLVLFKLGKCQEVEGMHASDEEFVFHNHDGKKTFHVDGRFKHVLGRNGKRLSLGLCYYTPVDRDCGAAITFNATHRETTIHANSAGRTDMDCSWIVKGPIEKGTLVLNFEEFDVKTKGNDGETCVDKVEVRHARIGAVGLTYCGKKVGHSIRTITDKSLIRFSTYGASTSSFKLKVKWIPDAALCYNVDDGGASYIGTVNYTRTFTPCLPWAQVTKCHHNTFQRGDEMDNLDGNYCRNPDDSFRPWCYTDTDGCKRNYCDVCKLETPFDRAEGCQELRTMGFCTRNATDAVRSCAATCYDLLPSTEPVIIYSQIECGPPTPPSDSDIVGKLKSKYLLGEKVEFRCKRDRNFNITSTCLTDGNWTPVDYTCLGDCPLDQVLHKNACYSLAENGKVFKYAQAKKTCENLGGFMAVPRSYQESKFIDSVRQGHVIWVPATDIAKEGTWVYEDGERMAWHNWGNHAPDNWAGAEDCIIMRGNTKWNDVYCWRKASTVCAIPKLDNKGCHDIQGKFCSGLTKSRPSMCKDFPDYAERFCPKTCGICGATGVKCSVQPLNPDVSVSTTDTTISVGSFITYRCARYTYHQEGDRVQFCRADGQLDGKPLVCGDCPLGFVHVNGSCHGLLQGRQLTFSQATDECRKLGGFVAYPRNEAENDFVHSIAAQARLWLGMTDFRGDFVLGDGLPMSWSNWASGESRGSGENCIVMTDDKKWHYSTCDEILHQVVCTVQKSGKNIMCYDEESLGQDYNGNVNYTTDYTPCLPWVDVAGVCNHHPFKAGDERDNLESNYCRNPDASDRPWCYTSATTTGCYWKYCDGCGLEKPRDRNGHCKKMKEKGLCLKDVAKATLQCASTCRDLLPSSGPTESYLQIECDTPIPPPDGDIVGATKSKYKLGDRVGFKCKRNQNVIYTTCLTSGEWSTVGFACQRCPFDYVEFNNTCYGFVDKELDYQDAQKECGKYYGGYLPRPVTQAEYAFISTLSNKHDIWLGGKYIGDGRFRWNDGTKVEETHWASGAPTNRGDCMYMNSKGKWDDTMCDYSWPELRLVCAVPKLDNVLCRDFLDFRQCQELLTGRPSMCSGDYPDFAREFCPETCGICLHGNTTATCPVPSIDPSSNVTASTSNPTIPMGSVVEYTCVKYKYQSEGDAVRACLASGELTGAPMKCQLDCPRGYVSFKEMCYGFIDEPLTYSDAEAECKRVGGLLASPKSHEENNYVYSIRRGKTVWLGASDRINEGDFIWADGTALTWSNWNAGEPNNFNDREDCVVLFSRKWNDIWCGSKFNSICAVPFK